MTTQQVILLSIGLVVAAGTAFWFVRRYWKAHSCSTCHQLHHSDTWFEECEICKERFCKEKVARHEDIIETISGVLGETVRVLDHLDQRHRRYSYPCGYEHIITLHRAGSASYYYCPVHMPRNSGPSALLFSYREKRRARNQRPVTSGWR